MTQKKHKNREIIFPVFAQIAILTTAVVILITVIFFYNVYKNEKENIVRSTNVLIDSITPSLLTSLGTGAHLDIERLLGGVITISGVSRAYIINSDNQIEYSFPERDLLYRDKEDSDFLRSLNIESIQGDKNIVVNESKNDFIINKTLSQIGSPNKWYLTIVYSLHSIKTNILFKSATLIFYVILIVLCSSLFFAYVFKRKISPISKVIEQVESISSDNYELENITCSYGGNLKSFIDAFNLMKVNIIKSQKKIRHNAHLIAIGESTAMIAHDVRRPLTGMKALLSAIPEVKDDPEQLNKMVASVDRSIAQTNEMLNDVMVFSKGADSMNREPLNLLAVLNSGIADALRNHPGSDVGLEYDFRHMKTGLFVDGQRVSRVVTNIIDNALDAMAIEKDSKSAKGTITITTDFVPIDGKSAGDYDPNDRVNRFVRLTIADSGPGIPADILPRILDPFVTSGKKSGTGLGLAICKKVIELHGGTIVARNKTTPSPIPLPRGERVRERVANCGAEFIIELPGTTFDYESFEYSQMINHSRELEIFRKEEERRIEEGDTANTVEFMRINKVRGRKSNLLIVDDEPLFRETIRSMLNSLDQVKDHVKIIEADSAEKGFELLSKQSGARGIATSPLAPRNDTRQEESFDYIITDLDLGPARMSGYDLAEKALAKYPQTYLLIHSNKRYDDQDKRIREFASKLQGHPLPHPPPSRGREGERGNARFLGFLPKPMKASELLQFLACRSFEEGPQFSRFGAHIQARKKALFINDDDTLLMTFKYMFKKSEVEVLTASGVSEALEICAKKDISIVFSDVNLGDNLPNGYDFLQNMRKSGKNFPIYMMSGYSKRDEEDKAMSLGANGYLQLPVEKEDLEALI